MATHSSVPAWRIPGMGEAGGLPSMGSHRVGHDWSDLPIDTFTRWTETFLTRTERATEACKALLKETVPRFGLPQSLQSDNGPSFIATISQNWPTCLGIKYYFHSSWWPQVLGKVERANQTLKRTLTKLCQETHNKWIHMLPISLMRVWAALKWPLLLMKWWTDLWCLHVHS